MYHRRFETDQFLVKTKYPCPVRRTAAVVTVTTSEDIEEQIPEPSGVEGGGWHPQLAHLPQLPHPLRARRQVSPPPPPPVAVELEVATTDMWCHTYTHNNRNERILSD